MVLKYILLIFWAFGLSLLLCSLYVMDTDFKNKKLCKVLAVIGGTIAACALTSIFIYFISRI